MVAQRSLWHGNVNANIKTREDWQHLKL